MKYFWTLSDKIAKQYRYNHDAGEQNRRQLLPYRFFLRFCFLLFELIQPLLNAVIKKMILLFHDILLSNLLFQLQFFYLSKYLPVLFHSLCICMFPLILEFLIHPVFIR